MGADLCVCFNLDAVLLDQSRVVDVDDAVAVDVGCNCLNVVKRQQLCRFHLNIRRVGYADGTVSVYVADKHIDACRVLLRKVIGSVVSCTAVLFIGAVGIDDQDFSFFKCTDARGLLAAFAAGLAVAEIEACRVLGEGDVIDIVITRELFGLHARERQTFCRAAPPVSVDLVPFHHVLKINGVGYVFLGNASVADSAVFLIAVLRVGDEHIAERELVARDAVGLLTALAARLAAVEIQSRRVLGELYGIEVRGAVNLCRGDSGECRAGCFTTPPIGIDRFPANGISEIEDVGNVFLGNASVADSAVLLVAVLGIGNEDVADHELVARDAVGLLTALAACLAAVEIQSRRILGKLHKEAAGSARNGSSLDAGERGARSFSAPPVSVNLIPAGCVLEIEVVAVALGFDKRVDRFGERLCLSVNGVLCGCDGIVYRLRVLCRSHRAPVGHGCILALVKSADIVELFFQHGLVNADCDLARYEVRGGERNLCVLIREHIKPSRCNPPRSRLSTQERGRRLPLCCKSPCRALRQFRRFR